MKRSSHLLLAASALLPASAYAQTVVEDPVFPGELGHAEILSDIFGGTFTPVEVDGTATGDFSNGLILVTRVDDTLDQTFGPGNWQATTLATFAGADQSFGTIEDGILFDVTGEGLDASGSAQGSSETPITFARFGTQQETVTAATDSSLNAGGQDHVITYTYERIVPNDDTDNGPIFSALADGSTDSIAESTYLLFFEDLPEDARLFDADFNDLVVEVTITPIPEPSSLALLGLGTLLVARRRRG